MGYYFILSEVSILIITVYRIVPCLLIDGKAIIACLVCLLDGKDLLMRFKKNKYV